ncbi:FimV/HubP family polar landmark protein [Shewanella sp. SP2S2-4]|uniref:FimV/HubP family polar landmark protein n=1 Tax=Shewanella vaxholmensis TaxID=3063535 RepID=A0ABU9UUU7_9GAMM|nr:MULTISPECIES: FimV/HubP family polar landmark protein [unclassified Shewanella]MDT3275774.1 FimV/HubP family polar landmark protein [Shewanella sp. SP2S2-4]MDT3308361.1 FimV/HubP family polar landmark protein [Shewanella sp. SP1S1-4]
MANIVKSLGLLALVCSAPSMAQVSHVSVNSRMFELGGYPKLRVNVIADNQDMSRLEFVVQQAGGEEKLMVEELNRFLVLLTGVEDVKDDKAKLLVREYRLDRWYEVKSINLFGEAKPTSAALSMSAASGSKNTTTALVQKRADKVNVQPVKVAAESTSAVGAKTATVITAANIHIDTHVNTHVNTKPTVPAAEVVTGFKFPEAADEQNTQVAEVKAAAKNSEPVAVKATSAETMMPEPVMSEVVVTEAVKTTNSELKVNAAETSPTASQTPEHCQLTYLAGETLWRIANRYANDWDVSVYGAMLAIYEANPAAFSKNKINALKSNAALSCPSKMILAQHANAKEAQAMFEAKEAGE